MQIDEFIKQHEIRLRNIVDFSTQSNSEFYKPENEVSDFEIEKIEALLNCRFPNIFLEFSKKIGGGYFGALSVLSLDRESEWYILDIIESNKNFIPQGFIPFIDDSCGGFFCFSSGLKNDEVEKIYYLDTSGNISITKYLDFFDLLIKLAYIGFD